MIPCCRIESINSCNASRPKSLRGCNALGTMVARSIWCTLSPDCSPSARGAATEGVPISAPRPLPSPDRAMGLRLPEQPHQRKQQSARAGARLWRAKVRHPRGNRGAILKKNLKKGIDTQSRNSVSTRMAPKQTRDFCPVQFFVCSEPSEKKPKQNTTGKEKEHIPCIH